MNSDEVKRLEEELKKKKAELERPFDLVGQANVGQPRKRGRPPKDKTVSMVDGESANDARFAAFNQRMEEIKRPASDSTPESMRDWAEKEIHNLLPEAVASLKWDIKYGDSKQRTEARDQILRATGVDKRDAANFGKGGQIVIQMGSESFQGINLPFLQRSSQAPSQPAKPLVETLTDGGGTSASKKEGK